MMITTLENKLNLANHDLFSKIVNVLKKTHYVSKLLDFVKVNPLSSE